MPLSGIFTVIQPKDLFRQDQHLMSYQYFLLKPEKRIWYYVNYKRLNTITKKDYYPIPFIKKTLAQLKDAKYFTKIDIRQAFYQIKISKDSKELITLFTRFGTFQYLVMLFDLYNCQASCQHLIDDTLIDFLYYFVQAYLEDILINSKMP